jgi:hypothetical protein
MFFTRSVPPKTFADYTQYRPLLRQDFRYRCAYCLRHEYFLGGEAGCCIDHHRPVHGKYARPDLIADYGNLYWCCRECNENKGDAWPDLEAYARGWRFLDPCLPEDDHDLHLRTLPDGSVETLTPPGKYTCDTLKLWRDQLKHFRAEMLRCQTEAVQIRDLLRSKSIPAERRVLLEALLTEIVRWLEPPVFDRPRSDEEEG